MNPTLPNINYLNLAVAGIAVFGAYKVYTLSAKFGGAIVAPIASLVDDAKTYYSGGSILESGVVVSGDTNDRIKNYVSLGYMAYDSDGNIFITETGEKYINSQSDEPTAPQLPFDHSAIDWDGVDI